MPTAFCDEENSLPPNSDPQRKQHMVPVVTYRNLHVLIQMCKNCAKKKKPGLYTCMFWFCLCNLVLFCSCRQILLIVTIWCQSSLQPTPNRTPHSMSQCPQEKSWVKSLTMVSFFSFTLLNVTFNFTPLHSTPLHSTPLHSNLISFCKCEFGIWT